MEARKISTILDTKMGTPYHKAPWRTGRRIHRTIYATQQDREARNSDPVIGMMDTPELAREAVAAHNNRLSRRAGTVRAHR